MAASCRRSRQNPRGRPPAIPSWYGPGRLGGEGSDHPEDALADRHLPARLAALPDRSGEAIRVVAGLRISHAEIVSTRAFLFPPSCSHDIFDGSRETLYTRDMAEPAWKITSAR